MPQLMAKQDWCKDPSVTGAGSGRARGGNVGETWGHCERFPWGDVGGEHRFAVLVSLKRGWWVIRGLSPRSRVFRNSSLISPNHAGQTSLRQPKAQVTQIEGVMFDVGEAGRVQKPPHTCPRLTTIC